MPLLMMRNGETGSVIKVTGQSEVRQHLSDMGFVPGTKVTVVQSQNGDMIIRIMDAKMALTKEMAAKIMVV